MLSLATYTRLLIDDLSRRLQASGRDERGLSESVQTALLVVFAITAVGIITVAVATMLANKAAIIAGS